MFGAKLRNLGLKNLIKFGIILLFSLLSVLVLFDSCGGKDVALENLNLLLDSAYTMRTLKVDMLVSDSGVVRYRLISPEWLTYDNPNRRQWVFSKGIRLETYDSIQDGRTLVVADSAVQHINTEVWELIGNVQMIGLNGELLCTPHLYWDRPKHKLYSNDTTYFQRLGTSGLHFQSFEAKDDLSVYDTYHNTGDVIVKDDKNSSSAREPKLYGIPRNDSTRLEQDSLKVDTLRGREIRKE